jgi:BolA family transcriptional regulator, general stress-responsive regulator
MNVQSEIERKLSDALEPLHMEVINESHMHSVPPGSESHFKVIVVSDRFNGKALIQRHRAINELLASEIAGPVHALSLHTLTPDEWFDDKGGRVEASPPCLGGSKADQ